MKKLPLVACLAGILPALAVSPTYVVPEETAGNTPTEPYDAWAKAANAIRPAAAAAEPGGTVKIAAGDYSAATGGLADNHAVVFEAVDPETDEPGEALLNNKFLDHSGTCPGEDQNRITLKKGCFTLTADSSYLEICNGKNSAPASNTVVVSGAGTKLKTVGHSFYVGYSMKDSCLKFTDHAVGELGPLYVSQNGASSAGATLIVEDGACVTNSSGGQAYIGYSGDAAHVVVSNGTLTLRGQTLLGAGARTGTTLYVGGAAPYFRAANQVKFLGDTVTTVDMAEAPLAGYVNTPISTALIYYRSTCSFHVAGLDALEERLVAAGVSRAQWTILQASGLGDADTTEPLNAQVETLKAEIEANNPSFTLERTGTTTCDLVVKYLGQSDAYVVPEGTAGVTPTPPYASWATASTNISLAADCVRSGGTVTILGGTYNESRYTKDYPVVFKAVKGMDDPTPGMVVVLATVMGYYNRAWQSGYDRTASFVSGTFKLNPASGGNAFIEHNNAWGIDTRPHFVATGKDTVIDASGKDLYIGYTSHNSLVELQDGARMYSKSAGVGQYETLHDITFVVGDGAAFTNAGSLSVGVDSTRVTTVVSNGTISAYNVFVDKDETLRGTKLQFKGARPTLHTDEKINLRGNAEVTFDVSEAALDGYKALEVGSVGTLSDGVAFVLTGIDALKARVAETAHPPPVRLTLVSARNGALPDALKAKLSAIVLPGDCKIVFRDGDAVLKVGHAGLIVQIR